ncbi:MAG: nucleoside hydrolase [Desulfovibrio sp.]|nr:nucleoside hydrolase [Desulfovibrio sp.]
MQKNITALLLCILLFAYSTSSHAGQTKEKVLLDSDMTEAFDDGIAMLLLAGAPNVELLGVTTLSGNSWVETGTACALRQLEEGGYTDIPVAKGLEYPLRPNRHDLFTLERKFVGRGHDYWVGSLDLKEPASWQAAYKAVYGQNPTMKPVDRHAVQFIIDTVRANPGEVTIAAIGPLGNLALAVRMAPDIVPLIKRVVYMGGAFFQQGNVTPAAEFNWYFDPEAARIAVRSPFREQLVLGLDLCEKVIFRAEHYDRFLKAIGDHPVRKMVRASFAGQSFEKDPNFTFFIWDVLVSAVIIDPSLITESVECFIDVNDQMGLSYGQGLAYPVEPPLGTQKARIVTAVDTERFWNLLCDPGYWKGKKQ